MKKTKKTDQGTIVYKVPNIGELFVLLGEMGYSSEDLEKLSGDDGQGISPSKMILTGKLLTKIPQFVDSVNLESKDGRKVNSIEEALSTIEFLNILNEVGADLLSAMQVTQEKKPSSKKQ
jgi:hypothetical protein